MTLELINSQGSSDFGKFMDISLTSAGDISTIENVAELAQSCCKAVVTTIDDTADDGYGTRLSSLRGSKNIYLVKGMAALSILSSLQNLRNIQLTAQPLERITSKAILGTVDVIQTQVNRQRFVFFIQVRSNADILTFEEATDLNVII